LEKHFIGEENTQVSQLNTTQYTDRLVRYWDKIKSS